MSMKTSFVSQFSLGFKQSDTKPQSFKQERKSRENSKQGHMNPLKMKTSFLRQSLTPSEQNLILNPSSTNNLQRNIAPTQPLVLQSDRREDFMMRKIVERFSNNASPKNMMYPEHSMGLHQVQRERDIIKLSGRKNEHLGMSQMHRNVRQEKENPANLLMNHSGIYSKPQYPHMQQPTFPANQKPHRLSQDTSMSQSQATVFDSSLAEYTSNLIQNDQASVLKEQLQVILKRLAKNQCDIEALKRDKSVEIQMEGVWKQFSLCENRFDGIEKRWGKIEEKLGKGLEEVEVFKEQVSKIGEIKIEFGNSIKGLESKLTQELNQMNHKLSHFSPLMDQSQMLNDLSKTMKTELENMLQRLNNQIESRIQSRIAHLKWQIKAQKVKESEQNNLPHKMQQKTGNSFTSSTKKAHQSIAIVYKQLIKAHSSQTPYTPSDRTKLLAGVFNQNQCPKKPCFSSPVTPQEQTTTFSPYFSSANTQPQLPSEIEINQVQYFIDFEGYLLDENMFYIVDELGAQIKIDAGMVDVLRKNGIMK